MSPHSPLPAPCGTWVPPLAGRPGVVPVSSPSIEGVVPATERRFTPHFGPLSAYSISNRGSSPSSRPRPTLVPDKVGDPLGDLVPSSPPLRGTRTRSQGSKAPRTNPTSSPILKASKGAKPRRVEQPPLPLDTPPLTQRAEDTAVLPRWMVRKLTEDGVITAGYTRAARIARCEKCRARIIKGWTEEPCATLAAADPRPVSNLGEIVAVLQGRMTFDLARRAGRLELDLREQDHIQGSPPESPGWYRARSDVVAAHRCHSEPLPTIESRIPSW